jgi:hypothetical protein
MGVRGQGIVDLWLGVWHHPAGENLGAGFRHWAKWAGWSGPGLTDSWGLAWVFERSYAAWRGLGLAGSSRGATPPGVGWAWRGLREELRRLAWVGLGGVGLPAASIGVMPRFGLWLDGAGGECWLSRWVVLRDTYGWSPCAWVSARPDALVRLYMCPASRLCVAAPCALRRSSDPTCAVAGSMALVDGRHARGGVRDRTRWCAYTYVRQTDCALRHICVGVSRRRGPPWARSPSSTKTSVIDAKPNSPDRPAFGLYA